MLTVHLQPLGALLAVGFQARASLGADADTVADLDAFFGFGADADGFADDFVADAAGWATRSVR